MTASKGKVVVQAEVPAANVACTTSELSPIRTCAPLRISQVKSTGHRRVPTALVSIATRASCYWAGDRIPTVNWILDPVFPMFTYAQPDAGGKDFIEGLNPNSLKVVTAFVEPSLGAAKADDKFQFERHGYFVADRVDHGAGRPVFNLAVGLKDSWASPKGIQ